MDVSEVLADLLAEQQTLDDIVADLDAEQWRQPTPSPGWTIADQIGQRLSSRSRLRASGRRFTAEV